MWIETALNGKLNKKHEIRVYFGEFSHGVIEKTTGDAFKKMKNFKLWILDESGNKKELKTISKENYYLASFVPKKRGTYTIVLNNDEIDVIDYTKYDFGIFKTHYHATAKVSVEKEITSTLASNNKGLVIKDLSVNSKKGKLQVLYKNKPLADTEVAIFVTDGWTKKMKTNKEGIIEFLCPWDTSYILEVTKKEEVPGTYKKVPYQFIWHCATYQIQNKKI